ncbi:hypothetical protein AGLY_014879 [Aphis glycines]|uniref:Uncharacterized protein n=1 Tax=Aphis glycines TaxID=307491 RepID=A0A6G0T2M1_APHGL|nr:hypothetical protein AGLY_014879 [Aphis glycines]
MVTNTNFKQNNSTDNDLIAQKKERLYSVVIIIRLFTKATSDITGFSNSQSCFLLKNFQTKLPCIICSDIWFKEQIKHPNLHAPHSKPSVATWRTAFSNSFISVSSSHGLTSNMMFDFAIRVESDPNKSTSSSSSSFTFGVSFSSGLEEDCVVFLLSNEAKSSVSQDITIMHTVMGIYFTTNWYTANEIIESGGSIGNYWSACSRVLTPPRARILMATLESNPGLSASEH